MNSARCLLMSRLRRWRGPSRAHRTKPQSSVSTVPGTGFEPVWSFLPRGLSPLRLPFRHPDDGSASETLAGKAGAVCTSAELGRFGVAEEADVFLRDDVAEAFNPTHALHRGVVEYVANAFNPAWWRGCRIREPGMSGGVQTEPS